MVAHSTLTGADLHEPKGVASASAGTVYVANGAGSGVWQKVGESELNTSEIFPNEISLSVVLPDISAASSVFLPIPMTWTLTAISGVLAGAITVANSTVTFTKNGSGTIATQLVPYTTSGEGVGFDITSLSNNTFIVGDYIKVTSDGGSTTTIPLYLTFIFERTA